MSDNDIRFNPDHSVKTEKKPFEGLEPTDACYIAPDDEEISHGPCKDGSKVYRFKSGTKAYVMRDGTCLVIGPDGTKSQKNADGKIIQLFADGRKTTINADGTKVEKATNGDIVTLRTDGTKITVFKEPQGENEIIKRTEHPDKTIIESHKDGLKTAYFPDGTRVETHKDSKVTILKDGTEITDYLPIKKNGLKKVTKFVDGVIVETFEDGHDLQTDTDGTTIETKPDGTRVQTFKDGATLTTNTDGTKVQEFPDGMTITIFEDGRKVQLNTYGVEIETLANGDKITKHPDGDIIEHYFKPRDDIMEGRKIVMKETKPDGTVVVTDDTGEMDVLVVAPENLPKTEGES